MLVKTKLLAVYVNARENDERRSNPVLIEDQKTRRMLQPLLGEKEKRVRMTWFPTPFS